MPIIEVKNLSKVYNLYENPKDRLKEALNPFKKSYHNELYALKNITFNIKQNEIFGIIGNNGSGKSTLLKIISGVLSSSSGSVSTHGKITPLLELGAGFNPELSGIDNIYLLASIDNYTKEQIAKKIKTILEFAEIGEMIYQPIKTYSTGMKARLAFSLAIHVNPDILIIDEVLSVGDASFQRKCFAKIENFKNAKKTIIFVSHSIAQIIQLCDRVIWLDKGELILNGDTKIIAELYQKYGSYKIIDIKKIRDEYQQLIENKKIDHKKTTLSSKKEKNSFYDVTLKPKSTIYYKENNAKIYDAKITTCDHKMVNVLQQNSDYIYSYKVQLHKEFGNIRFGVLFKTIEGLEIAGGSYSLLEQENINIIEKGSYKVEWKFKCLFNPGVYFVNAGVSSDFKHIHRVMDAYCFRVSEIKKNISNSLVNVISDFKLMHD